MRFSPLLSHRSRAEVLGGEVARLPPMIHYAGLILCSLLPPLTPLIAFLAGGGAGGRVPSHQGGGGGLRTVLVFSFSGCRESCPFSDQLTSRHMSNS